LNELTPKIRCSGKFVDPALIFSIDSKLFRDPLPPIEATQGDVAASQQQHHDEVETITLLRGASLPTNTNARAHAHAHVHTSAPSDSHHSHAHPEEPKAAHSPPPLDEPTLTAALHRLPKEYVYRVKGFIRFAPSLSTSAAIDSEGLHPQQQQREQQWWILNWAFGRWELVCAPAPATSAAEDEDELGAVRLTVMGERGEVQRYAKRLAEALGATVVA
jgi:G3E family GTPase